MTIHMNACRFFVYFVGFLCLLQCDPANSSSEGGFYLVYTGETRGYLEPCGCSDNPLGGLSRRASALVNIRKEKGDILLVSNGDLVAGYGEQDSLKLKFMLKAMSLMGYQYINLGELDHYWGEPTLKLALAKTNIHALRWEPADTDFVAKSINGVPVFIVATGDESTSLLDRAERRGEFPGLDKALSQAQESSFKVLLFHGSLPAARELAETYPEFNLIISGHANEDPAPQQMVGNTLIVNYGSKGKHIGVSHVLSKGSGVFEVSNELLSLDKTVPRLREIAKLIKQYDVALMEKQLVLKYSGRTALKPGFRYQGSEKCKACHGGAYNVWSRSDHKHAYDALVKAGKEHDPECVRCHTVGYGDASGFSAPGKRPDLRGVGCENCHGPGYPHRKSPKYFPMAKDKGLCQGQCHAMDHSPKFNFDEYWERIKH